MRNRWLILILLFSVAHVSQAGNVIVSSGVFRFALPAGWTLINKEEDEDFSQFHFQNNASERIKLGVFGKLSPVKFENAKKVLKKGLGSKPSAEGWTLKSFEIVPTAALEGVDEEIDIHAKHKLTEVSYTIYGEGRIAVLTITLNRNEPNIEKMTRSLLNDFKWK